MYIEPNTEIRLLSDIPIDPDETDTLYFATVAAQTAYFLSKTHKIFTSQTFQRHNRGYMRLECNTSDAYVCNYMMFKNSSYENKWFYAFIDSVEYVNDITTEIHFTIDPVQTWLWDYRMDMCFIERMHTPTDNIGDHIAPENLELGEMVFNYTPEQIGAGSLDDYSVVILYTDPNSAGTGAGYINEGVYQGCYMIAYDLDEETDIRNFIDGFSSSPDSIVAMYMAPKFAVGVNGGGYVINPKNDGTHINVGNPIAATDRLDGYLPVNKKMYTYPFNYFAVLAGDGQTLAMRYEFFPQLQPQVLFSGNACAPVSLTVMPYQYKKCGPHGYWPERVTISGFPECSWSTDAFRAWLAQNSVPIQNQLLANGIKGSINSGLALLSTDPTSGIREGVTSMVDQATNLLNQAYAASIAADITKGSIYNGNGDFAANRATFKHTRISCSNEYAARIDHYFTMFGYAIGKYGQPSRYTRTRFTYIKTMGANCGGNLPADDAQFIADCYNKGIRFWADTAHVGDYTLANGLISG